MSGSVKWTGAEPPPCCVCAGRATVFDTEYEEAYCESDAQSYGVKDGPWKPIEYTPATPWPGSNPNKRRDEPKRR